MQYALIAVLWPAEGARCFAPPQGIMRNRSTPPIDHAVDGPRTEPAPRPGLRALKAGIPAFIIVLLLMPLGHTLMVLIEKWLHVDKYIGAITVGALGVLLLRAGIRQKAGPLAATLLGLTAGVLVWTGWVEFSFVWVAEKLRVPPMMENGEVATRPEYLVMLSSLGLLATITLLFLFTHTKCQFFVWLQKVFGYKDRLKPGNMRPNARPFAVITFIETVMLIWTFYIVLLLAYDPAIAGDRHPATYLIAFGSLFWSLYLFLKLMRIDSFDYAIRYAIPTVVIFWNFVEVIGRWDLFKEVWIHPKEHWVENTMLLVALLLFGLFYVRRGRRVRRARA